MCVFIPSVSLQPWREDPLCYQRVQVLPHNRTNLDIDFMSMSTSSMFQNYPLMLTSSSTTFTECIPFECPTNTQNTEVVNFPRIVNGDRTNFLECTHRSNAGLPPNLSRTPSLYHGFWSSTLIQNSNGLFNNLQSCQSASSVAITYDCSARRNLATTLAS